MLPNARPAWTAIALAIGLIAILPSSKADQYAEEGAVFVMTNSTNPVRGNEVAMYSRSQDGDLNLIGFFPTGDLSTANPQLGSGPSPTAQVFQIASNGKLPLVAANLDGLGSSHSLILGLRNQCLFAVNAGSNSLSSFRVQPNGLSLASIEDTKGTFPVSLTIHQNLLFVLNSGAEGSIAGFQVSGSDCSLYPLAQDVKSLKDFTDTFTPPPPGEVLTSPAQISFTPDGTLLLVSIKGGDAQFSSDGSLVALPSGRMVVFPVDNQGGIGSGVKSPFSFANKIGGPFSFIFSGPRTIVVVNANTSTVAGFMIDSSNHLVEIGDPVEIAHFATCWIARWGNYVYAVSFGAPSGAREILGQGTGLPDLDGAIDGFPILSGGAVGQQITEVSYPPPGPGHTGNHGIDLAAVGSWLYFIEPRIGKIGRVTVQPGTGALNNLVQFSGLDPSLEPFPGLNPGIEDFLTRCFLQDPSNPSPECKLGSAQGITGF